MQDMDKILIVEDDRRVQKALRRLFETEGYAVDAAFDGSAGLQAARSVSPAAVVLDLRLPNMSGRDVCREIKSSQPNIPVIILSAMSDVIDKVSLLELGADDYVTKPFSPRELLARVRGAIRRSSRSAPAPPAAQSAELFSFDDVVIDFSAMRATRDGQPVPTTAQEFKILRFMSLNPNRVISRDELLNAAWGYQSYPTTRTVDNHMLKLRQKFEPDPSNPKHFQTVHGAGYKFIP